MVTRFCVSDSADAGKRLDLFLAHNVAPGSKWEGLSRSMMQRMIAQGRVTLNGRKAKPSTRLKDGDRIELDWIPPRPTTLEPESIPLDIVYEDDDCIVVNKSPGMVVHPAAGNMRGTLVNALIHHYPDLLDIGGERRPGLVHRLDKDTSGILVIARNAMAFSGLARQFRDRTVCKEYLAVAWGRPKQDRGIIQRPIGRHRSDRKKMSSRHTSHRVREAVTEWRLEERFKLESQKNRSFWLSLLRLKPRTGRTHQIRVHLADQGLPIVGDRVYGSRSDKEHGRLKGVSDFPRQALHAERLSFRHPRSGAGVEFCAPLWPDMAELLERLREASGTADVGFQKRG